MKFNPNVNLPSLRLNNDFNIIGPNMDINKNLAMEYNSLICLNKYIRVYKLCQNPNLKLPVFY